jgi:signal transduction histidine kinase
MESGRRPDEINTRLVYRVYAGMSFLAGMLLVGWGPLWLEASGQPHDRAALIRVLGSVLIAIGCFTAPLADLDPPARRKGLLWFAAGHAAIYVVFVLQQRAVWGSGFTDVVSALLFGTVILFGYLWQTAEGEIFDSNRPPMVVSLFSGRARSSTERLRSQYEQQIRQAASQEERNRLARDLHDSIKQQIFVVQTAAATAQARFEEDPSGAKSALSQVRSSAREAMTEMEAMLDQLRAAPLENVGLVEALKKQCDALRFRIGASVEFQLDKLPPSEALPPGAQHAIFRVAQEAMANIARHARASNVQVSLRSANGHVELRIEDDGSGFDANENSHGMGIANMRARAEELGGRFGLASRPAGGTCVELSIPYAVADPREYRGRALYWGGLLSFAVVLLAWRRQIEVVPWAILAALALTRDLIAYLRLRRQSKVTQ